MDNNLMSLLVTSVLTIIGWFIAAFWAVKQVNIAHKKNLKLQHEIMKQSIKDGLYKQFVELYSDIAKSSLNLINALNMVGFNMAFDEHKPDNELAFGWINLFDKANEGYSELARNIDRLEIWLDATNEFIPNATEIYEAIDEYKKDFTASDDNMKSAWIMLQVTFVAIQKSNKPNIQKYDSANKQVVQSINGIRSRLKESAKKVQRCLVTRSDSSAIQD